MSARAARQLVVDNFLLSSLLGSMMRFTEPTFGILYGSIRNVYPRAEEQDFAGQQSPPGTKRCISLSSFAVLAPSLADEIFQWERCSFDSEKFDTFAKRGIRQTTPKRQGSGEEPEEIVGWFCFRPYSCHFASLHELSFHHMLVEHLTPEEEKQVAEEEEGESAPAAPAAPPPGIPSDLIFLLVTVNGYQKDPTFSLQYSASRLREFSLQWRSQLFLPELIPVPFETTLISQFQPYESSLFTEVGVAGSFGRDRSLVQAGKFIGNATRVLERGIVGQVEEMRNLQKPYSEILKRIGAKKKRIQKIQAVIGEGQK